MEDLVLPEKLDLDGTFEEIFSLLYSIFKRDFIDRKMFYRNLPVVYDNRRLDSGYEEGFWHIVTRGGKARIPDYKRAKRITWLRPIIENYQHPDIFFWVENATDKKGRRVKKHYFWYKKGDYIIILKKIPKRYFMVTAFHVTGQRNHQYYMKNYMKKYQSQKKGPGC